MFHRQLTALLLTFIACWLPSLSFSQDPPSQNDLDELNETIERVQRQVEASRSERESLQDQVFESEKQIVELNTSLQTVEDEIAQQRQQLDTLHQQEAELESTRLAQQDTIARYLRSAWQSGREEYVKLLLNQQDISQTSRMVRYYQYFNQARAEKIAEYNLTLTEINEVAQSIEVTTDALENSQRALADQRIQLEQRQSERQERLVALESILNQRSEELSRLQEEREELGLLIEELNRSIVNLTLGGQGQPFSEMKGKLPWPTSGRVTNSFGSSQELGDLTWQGINIAAAEGTEIQAIHHGRVVFADWFGNSGLLLIIDHGDGYMSLYAQNQQLYHDVGDWVSSGELIATIGDTGGRRVTSLYFEIRRNSDSQDPIAWLQPRN